MQSLNFYILISLTGSAQPSKDSKSRRAVDSILAMVVSYERELVGQFASPY